MKYVLPLIMFLAVLVPVPSQAADLRCKDGTSMNSKVVNDKFMPLTEGKNWRIKVRVNYRYCYNPSNGVRWVKPREAVGSYNREGDSMNCQGLPGQLSHVRFNMYFWDNYGRNFNPVEFEVPCDESTMNSWRQRYSWDRVPKLYFPSGEPPRWKTNFKVVRYGSFGNPESSMGGRMFAPLG